MSDTMVSDVAPSPVLSPDEAISTDAGVIVTRLQEHMLKLSEEHGIGEYNICPIYFWGWAFEMDQYLLQLSEVLDDRV